MPLASLTFTFAIPLPSTSDKSLKGHATIKTELCVETTARTLASELMSVRRCPQPRVVPQTSTCFT